MDCHQLSQRQGCRVAKRVRNKCKHFRFSMLKKCKNACHLEIYCVYNALILAVNLTRLVENSFKIDLISFGLFLELSRGEICVANFSTPFLANCANMDGALMAN